jgi:hypothetical protein
MARFYFDLRDEQELYPDEEGLELFDIRAVQAEAAKSLADMARDAVHTFPAMTGSHFMEIDVRDDQGPVMRLKFTFEVERLKY